MAIKIRTTGLDNFLDDSGKTTNVKTFILGRPSSGKTRAASYWPRPFIVDGEGGLSVLGDRPTPNVEVFTPADLKEVERYLVSEAGKPSRQYDTVILDTVDGLQLRFKRDRLRKVNRASLEAFEGDYDAINTPITDFIEAIRALPYNVVVNCHLREAGSVRIKEKKNKPEDPKLGEDSLTELKAWDPDLVGGIRQQIAGWFDLVGLMENTWAIEGGKQVIARQIRWRPTPELPYLKDRFFAFPPATPVKFANADYTQLVGFISTKAAGLKTSEVVGEIGEPDKAVGPDVAGGPVVPAPDGVLTKPRKKAEKAEKAVQEPPSEPAVAEPTEPANEPEAASTEPEGHDAAVESLTESLGAEVVEDGTGYEAQIAKATTVDQIRALWAKAGEAGDLTPALKAKFTVRATALNTTK